MVNLIRNVAVTSLITLLLLSNISLDVANAEFGGSKVSEVSITFVENPEAVNNAGLSNTENGVMLTMPYLNENLTVQVKTSKEFGSTSQRLFLNYDVNDYFEFDNHFQVELSNQANVIMNHDKYKGNYPLSYSGDIENENVAVEYTFVIAP